jgi:hypothetical protein
VLGDFNRRFNIAENDKWRELDDGDPDLAKHTDGLTSTCLNGQSPSTSITGQSALNVDPRSGVE